MKKNIWLIIIDIGIFILEKLTTLITSLNRIFKKH